MILKKLILENTGPIQNIDHSFSSKDGIMKPLVLVGKNGSGKSIAISFLVNTIISGKQVLFDDVEVEKGKVYKLRSSNYVRNGHHFYYGKIGLSDNFYCTEFQLMLTRKEFEEKFKYTPIYREWSSIPNEEYSFFSSNFNSNHLKLRDIYANNSLLYFPPNRFEEPAWVNHHNLTKTEFSEEPKLRNLSNRQIICSTTLTKTKSWLLDIVFDSRVLERKNIQIQDLLNLQNNPNAQDLLLQSIMGGRYEGHNTRLIEEINRFLSTLFSDPANYRFGIGGKNHRLISIMRNDQIFVPDIQQLSTGQALIFSLFCSILRDFDKTGQHISSTNDVTGVVVIDEIDLHLHTSFQFELLPKLLRFFPKVQFIVTSHSPLFLLGMNKIYGEDGFDTLNLPEGEYISAEHFSEFLNAYTAYGESTKYQESIREAIIQSRKPIIFVEGDYDIRFLNKAAEYLGKTELLEKVELKDSNGFGNIDKVWKHFNSDLASITPQNIVLLYDCDTHKQEDQKGNVYKRVIPCIKSNPIEKGIENLLSKETLSRAITAKKAFIDITPSMVKITRGEEITVPETWEVNKDEKGNLCDWICENSESQDFDNFGLVFDILEGILN